MKQNRMKIILKISIMILIKGKKLGVTTVKKFMEIFKNKKLFSSNKLSKVSQPLKLSKIKNHSKIKKYS